MRKKVAFPHKLRCGAYRGNICPLPPVPKHCHGTNQRSSLKTPSYWYRLRGCGQSVYIQSQTTGRLLWKLRLSISNPLTLLRPAFPLSFQFLGFQLLISLIIFISSSTRYPTRVTMSTIFQPLTIPSRRIACGDMSPHPSNFNTQSRPDLRDDLHSRSPRFPEASESPTSLRRRARSPSTEPTPDRNLLALLLNSGCRSTLELLRALPTHADITKLLPILPTQYYTPSELDSQLPDPFFVPIVSCSKQFLICVNN